VADLYRDLPGEVLITDPASAETIKYASNAFLATKISFVNAMAAVCEEVGADVVDVTRGMGLDQRIGDKFLIPGPGWGGSCFPKDSHALVRIAENSGYQFGLLRQVIAVNEEQFGRVANKITRLAGGRLEGRTIAVWGLTFKARTDDLRDSPALNIINRLLEVGATVRAYDPAVLDGTDPRLAGIEVVTDPYEAVAGAHVLAVLTEWPEFAELDMAKVAEKIGSRAVVDGRNMLDGGALKELGFAYDGIGRA
jgi:UDPglucose 6-dehydrogenase